MMLVFQVLYKDQKHQNLGLKSQTLSYNLLSLSFDFRQYYQDRILVSAQRNFEKIYKIYPHENQLREYYHSRIIP